MLRYGPFVTAKRVIESRYSMVKLPAAALLGLSGLRCFTEPVSLVEDSYTAGEQ